MFFERWGWHWNFKQVADFNNTTLNEATEIGVIEFLNTLALLKDKAKLDNAITNKHNT